MSIQLEITSNQAEVVPYNDDTLPIYVRKANIAGFPNFSAPSHWHDDIELSLILSGEKQYNVNGQIVTVSKGDGIFINSRQLHNGFSRDKTDCQYLCVLLHPILLCSNQYMEETFVRPVVSNQTFAYKYLSKEISWQRKILDKIKELYDSSIKANQGTFHLEAHRIFFAIWSLLYPYSQKYKPSEVAPESNINLTSLKEMLYFIQTCYPSQLMLQDIAEAGRISKSSCNTIFKDYLHQTPMEYVINYRLTVSMELLDSSKSTITDISHAVGFSSASYYTETFRKHVGCTPSQYRQRRNLWNT